jgi:lipoic acid synthetase
VKRPTAGPGAQRDAAKTARIPVRVAPSSRDTLLRKPPWIRARATGTPQVIELKRRLRQRGLHTVCEEAACPNLGECFASGTATFMIMGALCTRRCPFCDVAHGRPEPLDPSEPGNLALAVQDMGLRHVVITSVDRDDLRDGGAGHFRDCIRAVRELCPKVRIEVLVPDFRGRLDRALDILDTEPPDIFNHNLETVPRLYRAARPGADYRHSLDLLRRFRQRCPQTPTKSGLMLGLGETADEVVAVLGDLWDHGVSMLTLGQYLQPSLDHLPVARYWSPEEFDELAATAHRFGFRQVASGPMIRSSYHAERQAAFPDS